MSEYLFAYGTLQPGLAPAEIAPAVERLRLVGEGFVRGRLYDLGSYPGAVLDAGAVGSIYGAVYELPQAPEILDRLDAYEGPEYRRVEQDVTLVAGGVRTCWVYDYRMKPGEDRLIQSGRWSDRRRG
jgi:gamma-glutamylcyclotransferase (GGCT)/AIG2-like uncharacterized protein YtfP